MKKLLVRDIMSVEVFTLRADDDLTTLYDLMDAEHIRHIPVVDDDGRLVGLVTHRDLLRGALGNQEDLPVSIQRDLLRRTRIGEIMIEDVETIAPDRSIEDAAQVMLEYKYGCLPVLEDGRLVGIITEADFVRCLSELAATSAV